MCNKIIPIPIIIIIYNNKYDVHYILALSLYKIKKTLHAMQKLSFSD